jgi:methenyltetrahydromethanopterin cyclohydrolase
VNTLNEDAAVLADVLQSAAKRYRVGVSKVGRATLLDCGIATPGGLEAGRALAEVCLAQRGDVAFVPSPIAELPGPAVQVTSDDPVLACMASQYAGWQVSVGKYFAMGSGPMRAAYGKEEIFDHVGYRESPPLAVGVLETRKPPTEEVVAYLAERVRLPADRLTLLAAPCASLAGTVQVVARALETALHKMHEIGFDLKKVVSGYGVAPLPPVAADEMAAIGRTNDAILYGGLVTVWLNDDDEKLAELGPKVPSSASGDHGAPFAEIFERAGRDFYKIDKHLFSPAVIALVNLKTGRRHVFGRTEPAVLRKSFG